MPLKNKIRGLLHRHGTEAMKRAAWDKQFSTLRPEDLKPFHNDCILPYLAKFARGGDVLDIGCGPGVIGNALASDSYRNYHGVDVSSVAINWAKAHDEKGPRNVYLLGDMCSFEPSQKYSVILFADSLYYNPFPRTKLLLQKFARYLIPDGVILMRTCIGDSSIPILQLIESDYSVVEKNPYEFNGSPGMVIAFVPKG